MFFRVIIGIIAILISLKTYFLYRSKKCSNFVSLVGRTVLVTGANSGIGFEAALEFAKRGARVLLACRDKKRAETARDEIIRRTENDNVVVKLVDFRSLQSVIDCAENVVQTEKTLDILVNNAGVGATLDRKTSDGLDFTMQINYFAPFLLTVLLIDLIKKSPKSRIINVSSIMAKIAVLDPKNLNNYPGIYGIYANSKLCNILFTQKLAKVLKGTNVTTFSLHPGAVNTNIFRRIRSWRKLILRIFSSIYFKTSQEGAQTIIYTATEQGIEQHSGQNFEECDVAVPYPNAVNDKLANDVWEETFRTLNLDKNKYF